MWIVLGERGRGAGPARECSSTCNVFRGIGRAVEWLLGEP